jgi:hypothetical protein
MRLVHLGMKYGLVDLAARLGRTGWALRFARPLLEQQDAPTQWYVGLMYHTTFGVEKDLTIARQFYERSAAQDFSPASRAYWTWTAKKERQEAAMDPTRAGLFSFIARGSIRIECWAWRRIARWRFEKS